MRGKSINYLLFLATIFTTVYCGTMIFRNLPAGVMFSVVIMTILLIHEMGHYLNARKHKIDVTLPYFIPIPFALGTFGAVIRIKSSVPNRNALMDMGAAGPLNGFIAAVVALILGLCFAPVYDAPEPAILSVSLLYSALAYVVRGVSPAYIGVTPLVFAGWLGCLLTMLNLLPIGQLDGGHVIYALFGKSNRYEAGISLFFKLLIGWGVIAFFHFMNPAWLFWAGLIYFLHRRNILHPPVDYEIIELTPRNRMKGWLCILIFIITFMPTPLINVF